MFHVILVLHLYYILNTILIILCKYGMTPIHTDILHLYLSTCIARCKRPQLLWLSEDGSVW